jgi:hypothetical protein
MKLNFLAATVTALLITTAGGAMAQSTRAELVQRIAVAQGLTDLIDQQLVQVREVARTNAAKLFDQAVVAGQANPKELAVLHMFLAKAADLVSANEIAAVWVTHYGQDLSLPELQGILNYYESPIGRKDSAAAKLAMPAFSSWMARELQARLTTMLQNFALDLQAARN